MIINRKWAMPNKHTFLIKPIRDVVLKYVGNGSGWIDPFSGFNSMAEHTNDLNPLSPTKYHLDAIDFINKIKGKHYKGIIYDPPYSLRQVKECYEGIGKTLSFEETKDAGFGRMIKDIMCPYIDYTISCGWNSNGFGMTRGFEIIEILIVAHGGNHNDTIVTIEKKSNRCLQDFGGE